MFIVFLKLPIKRINIIEYEAKDMLHFDKINFGEISKAEKRLVFRLLLDYKQCISTSLTDLGKTNAVEMHIRTDEQIVYQPYRMSLAEKNILNNIIKDFLVNRIIRISQSPYASPVVLVKK